MESENRKQINWALPASIIMAGIFIAIAVIYSSGAKNINTGGDSVNKNQANSAKVLPKINSDDVVLGNPDAKVEFIEFGDYQCPFCAKFFNDTKPLIKKYYIETGKAKMVYKDLAFLGPESFDAALAVNCAKDQNKFWEFHDEIYKIEYKEVEAVLAGKLDSNEHNGNLNRDLFKKISADLKMDEKSFLECFDSKKYKDKIERDVKEANDALEGKTTTPSFFINGQLIQGAYPFSNFKAVIDKALGE